MAVRPRDAGVAARGGLVGGPAGVTFGVSEGTVRGEAGREILFQGF